MCFSDKCLLIALQAVLDQFLGFYWWIRDIRYSQFLKPLDVSLLQSKCSRNKVDTYDIVLTYSLPFVAIDPAWVTDPHAAYADR